MGIRSAKPRKLEMLRDGGPISSTDGKGKKPKENLKIKKT